MEDFVVALADAFAARELPFQADPKRSIFRIYRDTRFAKDKSPYKTHIGASFPWLEGDRPRRDDVAHRARQRRAISISSPATTTRAAGCGMRPSRCWTRSGRPSSTTRAGSATPSRIRAFIAEFGPVESHETLKRVPPGYPPDHPMADLFRYKDIVFGRRLSDDEVYSPELPDILATAYAARDAGVPVPVVTRRLSARRAVRGCLLDPAHRLAGPPRRLPGRRTGRAGTRSGSTTTCLSDEADWADPKLEGWASLAAVVVDHDARPPRPAGVVDDVPQPGADRQAGDARSTTSRRSRGARPRRRLVRARARRVRHRLRGGLRRAAGPAGRGDRRRSAACSTGSASRTTAASSRCGTRCASRARCRRDCRS